MDVNVIPYSHAGDFLCTAVVFLYTSTYQTRRLYCKMKLTFLLNYKKTSCNKDGHCKMEHPLATDQAFIFAKMTLF